MNEPIQPTEAEKIIEVAREAERHQQPKQVALPDGHPVLIMPNGRVIDLERYLANPRRQRAYARFYEAASFIGYLNAYMILDRTVIFGEATERRASFTAIIDYHQRGLPNAGNGDHRVELTLETTPEWLRWIENNNKLLSQEQFAEFIEDNLTDIIEPDGAEILEMAQLLQGKKSVAFKAGRNLRDGSIQLEYSEEIQLNGGGINRRDDKMKLPEKFKLGLVPFVGANGIEIEARLRFRIGQSGSLSFSYILNRPHNVIKAAFEAARTDIEQNTKLPVHLGHGRVRSPNEDGETEAKPEPNSLGACSGSLITAALSSAALSSSARRNY